MADRGCQLLHHLTRGLDRTLFLKLAGCDWIREHGPSGRKPAVLGREYAALAIAIVSTKAPGYFLRGAGGFAGMVRKAEKGELHLERTLWALRQAKWGEPPPLPCANA